MINSFIQGKYDIKLSLDTVYFETDHRFSTIADYKAAKNVGKRFNTSLY